MPFRPGGMATITRKQARHAVGAFLCGKESVLNDFEAPGVTTLLA